MRCVPPLPGSNPRLTSAIVEGRMLGRNADVGAEQQRHATGEAIAIHGRDHRLPHFKSTIEQLIALRQPHLVETERGRQEALDVGRRR